MTRAEFVEKWQRRLAAADIYFKEFREDVESLAELQYNKGIATVFSAMDAARIKLGLPKVPS